MAANLGIGWIREGFYWNNIEHKRGVWDWQATDQAVLGAHAEDLQILPLLAYTASWDASTSNSDVSPPKNVADWDEYVERVVARYSAPPFNLRYFQIWNEPTRKAGFWTGTDQDFVDKVYLPAAEIVRRHHCYVVFGGWPASNSLQEFDNVLEYHDAWRWTDFLDIHYEGLPDWQYLYDRWVKTGKCKGVWETELGFTNAPDFIPETYLPMLHWSLLAGWKNPNAYKLFWYAAWGAGADGPNCLTQTDPNGKVVLSDQGNKLAVLNKLLGSGPLTVYSDYKITPLPSNSSVFGFRCGGRVVVAMLLSKQTLLEDQNISLRIPVRNKPSMISLVDGDGVSVKFIARFNKRYVTVKVLVRTLGKTSGQLAVEYLEVDPSHSKD